MRVHHASTAVMMMCFGKCGGESITTMGTTVGQVVIRWIGQTSTEQLVPVIRCHGQFGFGWEETEDEVSVLVVCAVENGFHVSGHGVGARVNGLTGCRFEFRCDKALKLMCVGIWLTKLSCRGAESQRDTG
jgi:hypothetical protein